MQKNNCLIKNDDFSQMSGLNSRTMSRGWLNEKRKPS